MSLLRLINRLTSHPVNADRKTAALFRFFKWQVGSRLVPGKVLVNWIDDAKFVAGPGERGVTGNIYSGLHEFHDMAFVVHVLNQDDWFADVGANVGSYSLLAGKVAGARGYCFEPAPATFRRLMLNLSVNSLLDRVVAFNQAVGDKRDLLRFTSAEDCTNHVLAPGERALDAVEVPVATLDESIENTPSVIKIDVEGYETLALRGATRILSDPKLHSILIELNGSGARYGFDERAIERTLEEHGFKRCSYDPFLRTVSLAASEHQTSGNSLYIRDIEFVAKRVREARPIDVLGKKV